MATGLTGRRRAQMARMTYGRRTCRVRCRPASSERLTELLLEQGDVIDETLDELAPVVHRE